MNLYAILTQEKNTSKHPAMPLECIYSWILIDKSDQDSYKKAGYLVLSSDEYKEYIQKTNGLYIDWLDNHSGNFPERRLKVYDLVPTEFQYWPPSKIDFRRHLKEGINFEKKLVMLPNGRPDRAEYFYNGEKYAQIEFIFEVDAFNFMTKRTEVLSYIRKDGSLGHKYEIWSQTYSKDDVTQQGERIAERVEARTHIFTTIKAKVETFLVVHYMYSLGKTYEEVLEIGGEFSIRYSALINAWKDTGTPALKNAIQADEDTEWMQYNIPAAITGLSEDMPIKDYITLILNY